MKRHTCVTAVADEKHDISPIIKVAARQWVNHQQCRQSRNTEYIHADI